MLEAFLLSWVLAPIVMLAVLAGCGLLVRRAGGDTVPRVYVLPLGFATVMLLGGSLTWWDATAELTPAALVAVALAGLLLDRRALAGMLRPRAEFVWPLLAAAVPFAVMAAPVVLSGEIGFTGYGRIVDIAHQLEIGAHLISEGRSLPALGSSGADEVVMKTLPIGYPGGWQAGLAAFGPLTGVDPAWIYQPFLAITAAMGGLAVYGLLGRIVESRALRSLAGAIAAQGNVMFAYGSTGGCKELSAAVLILLTAGLVFESKRGAVQARALVPVAVAVAGGFSVLNLAVLPWIGVLLAGLVVVSLVRRPSFRLRPSPAWIAAGVLLGVLLVPAVVAATKLRRVAAQAEGGDATVFVDLGNLASPMPVEAVAGTWFTGDYRFTTSGGGGATTLFILLILALAALGVAVSLRRRDWRIPLLAAAGAVGLVYFVTRTGPWLELKAIAITNPIPLVCAFVGAAALLAVRGRLRLPSVVAGWALAAIVAGGVLYGNAVAYHDIALAPTERLRDLEELGDRYAGMGPTYYPLHEEYAEYFLRRSDATAFVNFPPARAPLPRPDAAGARAASPLQQFGWEVDELELAYIQRFELIIRRRAPRTSRPPSNWTLAERTRWHEVWRRTGPVSTVLVHQPLDPFTGSRRTVCETFAQTAAQQGAPAAIAYATKPLTVTRDLQRTNRPLTWPADMPGAIGLTTPGVAVGRMPVPKAGRWRVWIEGSFGRRLEVEVDGRLLGAIQNRRNYPENGEYFGSRRLDAGVHDFALIRGGGNLDPGNGGGNVVGPMVLERIDPQAGQVRFASLEMAGALCRRRDLDWIEIVRRRA